MKKNVIIISDKLRSFIEEWKEKPGNLIMILHKAQEEYGYLSAPLIEFLAKTLYVSRAKIYGVATFYHFFKLQKPGRHVISVCMGTACYLKGAEDLLKELMSLLEITLDETTEDGCFSLETVRCIGCCGLAPVIAVDGEVFGRVQKKELPKIVSKYRDQAPAGAKVETKLFAES
jgi:NADH-quinone oxidoreductase subunit E